MKPVKNLVYAALLVFSLTLHTVAGEIDVPGAPAPQPPRLTACVGPLECPNTDEREVDLTEPSDYLFYEALAALLSVY